MKTTELIAALGRAIYDAERDRAPLQPISGEHPSLGPEDAYAVQEAYAALRMSAGARLVGRKIGATSRAIQELFGVHTPDYGHIFHDMVVPDAGTIRLHELIQPMVEPELAFVIRRDLRGPGVGRADVLEAIQTVVPCLEIIDSRIADWKIAFVDTVADNGSSARCVFGPGVAMPAGLDLREVQATMRRNGEVAGTATGEAVLGHPADAIAWLANALATFDTTLHAGQHVMSGSFIAAVRATPGDVFDAEFSGIGRVSCRFE